MLRFLLSFIIYLLVARGCLYLGNYRWKVGLFALTNLAGIGFLFDWSAGRGRAIAFFGAYILLVVFHYLMLRLFAERADWLPWLAFLAPIIALVVIRYMPFVWDALWRILHVTPDRPVAAFFIGISYMAFRLSHLVLEVRNGVVPRPSLWEYLGFAFFIPTLVVGPINPYSTHQRSLAAPDRAVTPVGRSLLRLIVGAAKFQFLGAIFNQLAYEGLLLDGHPHAPLDLVIAAIAYYLFLYCNFSGFCDMAIGTAGLLGIHVKENFQNPFAARNVKEFWNRWHITLSVYMRDMVFAPLSKYLVGRVGARHAHHAIALVILTVFLLVGIWHGVGWHYALFGATHAGGVIANHYYTIWLKKRLGKTGFKAYNENPLITAVAVVATFTYVTASLFFFANDTPTMKKIFNAISL